MDLDAGVTAKLRYEMALDFRSNDTVYLELKMFKDAYPPIY